MKNEVLELCEQMCRLERRILTTKNIKLKVIMRDEYRKLADQLDLIVKGNEALKKAFAEAADRARMPDGSLSVSRYIAECDNPKQVEKEDEKRSETATPTLR